MIAELQHQGCRVRGQYRTRIPEDRAVEWVHFDFAAAHPPDIDFEVLIDGVDAVIHLAASLAEYPDEMEAANIINLERFAAICAARGVRYFGQASSMVVYGSPRASLVSEDSPLIDVSAPLGKQYYADAQLQAYARSKRIGEDILRRLPGEMRIDLYRIAVAQHRSWLESTLHWGRPRRIFALYRNTHFISSRNVARAIVHLMTRALHAGAKGVEAYNICDKNAPTWRDVWRNAGRDPGPDIPFVVDFLLGAKQARSLAFRYPHGAFRMDDKRLAATGFVMEPNSPRSQDAASTS